MKETRALKIDSALGLRRPPARRRPWQWLARLSGEVLHALVFGLTLGALVHIVTVFVIPFVGPGKGGVFDPPWPDPAFVTMVCRFDLAKGPQRIRARAPDGFAGLSLHAPGGGVLYAVTDEVAQAGELSLHVMTPAQAPDVARGDGADVRFVVPARYGMPVTHGLAVYRVMAPWPSLRDSARATAATLRCDG